MLRRNGINNARDDACGVSRSGWEDETLRSFVHNDMTMRREHTPL